MNFRLYVMKKTACIVATVFLIHPFALLIEAFFLLSVIDLPPRSYTDGLWRQLLKIWTEPHFLVAYLGLVPLNLMLTSKLANVFDDYIMGHRALSSRVGWRFVAVSLAHVLLILLPPPVMVGIVILFAFIIGTLPWGFLWKIFLGVGAVLGFVATVRSLLKD